MRHSTLFLSFGVGLEILSVAITILCATTVEEQADEQRVLLFERSVDHTMEAIQTRLAQYETVMLAGAGIAQGAPGLKHARWQAFTAALDLPKNFPGCQGFGLVRRVKEPDLPTFLEAQKTNGWDNFELKSPNLAQPEFFIVHAVEPEKQNLATLGVDIASDPKLRKAAEQSMLSGQTALSGIVTLLQDDSKKAGFWMLKPHYHSSKIPDTEQERTLHCAGWVCAFFPGENIVADLLSVSKNELGFFIYDDSISEENLISAGPTPPPQSFKTQREVSVAGRKWIFCAHSIGLDASQNSSPMTKFILAGGVAISTALLAVLFLLYNASDKALLHASQAIDIAEEAAASKSRFLAVMSHEIRTPLNGVLGMAELALHEEMPEHVRDKIDTITSSGKTLLGIVNDILDFSRFAAGTLLLESLPFDASAEVLGVINLLKEAHKHSSVQLIAQTPDSLWLKGDPLRFRQILLNLVSNALKFTEDGSVTVKLESSKEGARITVTDTGIGMGAETLATLFEPFVQADASTSRRFGGTGLGLAIVKTLVDCMRGSISVESRLNRGSSFHVLLPLPPTEARPAPKPVLESPKTLRLKVLLAEDTRVNQVVASNMLKKLGCTVSIAQNGREAITMAKDHDVILMDCQMPEMDGLEATRRLRISGLKIPIIALTANAIPEDKLACLAAGMNDFITKPITLKTLSDVLAKQCSLIPPRPSSEENKA